VGRGTLHERENTDKNEVLKETRQSMEHVSLSDIPCGPWAYHYTRAETAIQHILHSGNLRLSSLRRTNDRDETEPWAIDLGGVYGSPSEEDLNRYLTTARIYFQDQAYLLSAVADEPHDLKSFTLGYGMRGFAMHSMWSHYGGRYAGVCLAFDRDALSRAFAAQIVDGDAIYSGLVRYHSHVPTIARTLDIHNVAMQGFENYLKMHLESHHMDLYFQKQYSWSYEREYRWIIHLSSSVYAHFYISFGEAIRAIFIDDKCADGDVEALRQAAHRWSIPLYRIVWSGMTPPGLRRIEFPAQSGIGEY
jgi:hypothetical protein